MKFCRCMHDDDDDACYFFVAAKISSNRASKAVELRRWLERKSYAFVCSLRKYEHEEDKKQSSCFIFSVHFNAICR